MVLQDTKLKLKSEKNGTYCFREAKKSTENKFSYKFGPADAERDVSFIFTADLYF